jgi:hypothetical protein
MIEGREVLEAEKTEVLKEKLIEAKKVHDLPENVPDLVPNLPNHLALDIPDLVHRLGQDVPDTQNLRLDHHIDIEKVAENKVAQTHLILKMTEENVEKVLPLQISPIPTILLHMLHHLQIMQIIMMDDMALKLQEKNHFQFLQLPKSILLNTITFPLK